MQDKHISPDDIKSALNPLFKDYQFVRGLYQKSYGTKIHANLNQTLAEGLEYKQGIVISVVKNGVVYESSSSLISHKQLNNIVKNFQIELEKHNSSGVLANMREEENSCKKFDASYDTDRTELSELVQKAQNIVHQIQQRDKLVVMSQAMFKRTINHEYYISRHKQLEQKISYVEAIFSAVLKYKQYTTHIYDGYGYQGSWDNISPSPNLLDMMLQDGNKILTAKRIQPGFYTCIFAPSMSGMLAHEAFGHGTEADTLLKNRAKAKEYINKQVASPLVTLVDSPALKGVAGSYFFDHEGQEASETHIVDKGILKQPITDHRSASVLGIKRTPNGRRESYKKKVYSRMTNTYFLPGHDTIEDMIASVKSGYFIKRATNGMEDPKGWGIQLEGLYAEKITNGKLTGEVYSPVIITGYVPDVLKSISMMSQEFEINGLGMCGKGHKEWVKVTDGGPYLKLRARLG